MRQLLGIILIAIVVAAVCGGCSVIGCTENQNSIPLAGFYSSADGKAISVDSLAIGGMDAPDDSLLVRPSSRASQVYLPLRANRSQTAFYIKYMQKAFAARDIEDVIIIDYESKPWFASEDCGAMYVYRITSLEHTTNLIDSVTITVADSTVTNVEREYLRIYFRTASPEQPTPQS